MVRVFVDMDGVLANFQHHFDNTIDHGGLDRNSFDDYEHKITGIKDWWLKMPILGDAKELVNYLHKAGVDIHVLSAAPEWQIDGKKQKTAWINKHFDIKAKNIHIVRRVEKKDYAKKGDILIDDYKRNIKEWEAAGGIGILHTKTKHTLDELRNLGIS